MSALSDKINSYSLERGISFNETFTLTPTRTGTNPLGTFIKNAGTSTVYESGSGYGPVGGNGSWNMPISTTAANNGYFRETSASADELANLGSNYSVGFWFKVNSMPTGTSNTALQLLAIGSTTQNGFLVYVTGSSHSTNPSQLRIAFGSSGSRYLPVTLNGGTWYYLAVTRGAGGNSNNMHFYLDGTLIETGTHSATGAASTLTFGNTSAGVVNGSWNFSDYYQTSLTEIDATQIAEIWNVGSTGGGTSISIEETPATASALSVDASVIGNASITDTPATATALQTEPTIAVETGDHTEITTSITVSATITDATVSTQTNLNLTVDAATAEIDLINNVVAGSSTTVSFSSTTFEASAEMTEAIVSRPAMLASAQSGDHTVYVTPSQYAMVKAKNPLFYFEFDDSTLTNQGSWTLDSVVRGTAVQRELASGGEMGLVGQGQSWRFTGNASNSQNYVRVTPADANNTIGNLEKSRNFTIEYWFKPTNTITGSYSGAGVDFGSYSISYNDSLQFGGANDFQMRLDISFPGAIEYNSFASNEILHDEWNHVLLTVKTAKTASLWVNGSFATTISFTDPDSYTYLNFDYFSIKGTHETSFTGGAFIDQFAIYPRSFSNSEIIDHYSFISNLSPDASYSAQVMSAASASGSHAFVVVSNAIPEVTVATASALAVEPNIMGGKSKSVNATAITASATIADPSLSLDTEYTSSTFIAYAEKRESYALNSIYFDYVNDNFTPYRYVTFDAQNEYADYGSDADYSVASTVVGGTIVNPDEGITGKSAKTAGTNYATDGVILKESEWNDTWGTGANDYHSSFWFQRAANDASTTGLRVLWNLNGYNDNQHVILYQYQGKLHMQFNNGSGTHLEQSTASNIDLFDYKRHFVAINFDHVNPNANTVKLYVDSVLVMTVNLGSYNGETVNYDTYQSPNSEDHNHPRLAIGCLITPFAETALPVVPANTRLIVDEIIWVKNGINQTGVTGLFNAMPDKSDTSFDGSAITASAEIVEPTYSTTVNYVASAITASALMAATTNVADRKIVVLATALTASSLMVEAIRRDNANVTSDIMVATAIFNDAGARITMSFPTMYVSANFIDRLGTDSGYGIRVNGNNINYVISPWASWLRSTQIDSILPTREVK